MSPVKAWEARSDTYTTYSICSKLLAVALAERILGTKPCRDHALQVITLDMGLLVAGTKYRGEFEERLKKLMEEIKQNDDIILVSARTLVSCQT